MATLKDVAIASGVSTATVSHVLHGRWERVSEATRNRVMKAVRQLDYKPSPYRTRRGVPPSHNLAFIGEELGTSPIASNPYFSALLDGFMGEAWRLGYSVTVDVERVALDGLQKVRRSFDGRCDGVALMAPCVDSLLRDQLVERGMPLVAIGSTVNAPRISTVDVDNVACGRMAVEYLAGLGHRKLAFLGIFEEQTSSKERLEGVRAAAQSLDLGEVTVLGGAFTQEAGRCMAEELLLQPKRDLPTAVICATDEIAAGVLTAFQEAGIDVPGQISVIGTDDTAVAKKCNPPLTTIRQPLHLMGARAASILAERIKNRKRPDERVLYNVELVERDSTAAPRR